MLTLGGSFNKFYLYNVERSFKSVDFGLPLEANDARLTDLGLSTLR